MIKTNQIFISLQEMQNSEKVFPIFFKKKVLPLEKTKELQEMVKELMQDNEQLIDNEKLLLDKIRAKDNEFIALLENHLERFKMAGIEKIILTSDMLPAWSQENESSESADVIDDVTHRLAGWYETMATYVSMQRDGVNQIVSDWFSQMDKIAGEGETDPQGTIVSDLAPESLIDSETFWDNISWYIILILFCALNIVIFYKPEDVNQCIDDGFCKCFVQNMIKISAILHDHYLRFHNITPCHPSMASNSSIDNIIQCSPRTEL